MNSKKMRALFSEVQQQALRLAEKCDFSATGLIERAEPITQGNAVVVTVECRDTVDRAQIAAAYTFGAALYNWSFTTAGSENVPIRKRNGNGRKMAFLLTLVFTAPEGK